jgi:hypothetical protein
MTLWNVTLTNGSDWRVLQVQASGLSTAWKYAELVGQAADHWLPLAIDITEAGEVS